MQNRLDLEDLLLIAEAVLGVPGDELEQAMCVYSAASALAAPFARIGDVYLRPDPVEQAAVCAVWIIRSRPFPIGNKQVGYECMLEMLVRGGYRWPREDEEEIVTMVKGVEAGAVSEAEFVRWVRQRVPD